jgi:hypothetical protein
MDTLDVARSRIDPDAWYPMKTLIATLNTGPRTVYRAVQRGELRAARVNDRGDYRVLGQWAINWLVARTGSATTEPETASRFGERVSSEPADASPADRPQFDVRAPHV